MGQLRWGNCLWYAFSRWMTKGGYLIVRKSRYGWWPHFLWSPDLKTFEQFRPRIHRNGLWIAPPIFRGSVVVMTADERP